jgi:hypothetical protein
MFGLKLASAALALISVALFAALTLAGTAGAGTAPAVRITSETTPPGTEGTVELSATDIAEPGLAAWSIDVEYDPAILTAVSCEAAPGGVCNPAFTSNSVRIAGAVASGLVGDSVLGTITFRCNPEGGESTLRPVIRDLADATLGGPVQIAADRQGGTFICKVHVEEATSTPRRNTATPGPTSTPPSPPELPDAGGGIGGVGGGGASPISWLIAGLTGAGLAWLAASLAGRRFVPNGSPHARSAAAVRRDESAQAPVAGWFAAARRDLQGRALDQIAAFQPPWRRRRP